jgi:hypothetical protein
VNFPKIFSPVRFDTDRKENFCQLKSWQEYKFKRIFRMKYNKLIALTMTVFAFIFSVHLWEFSKIVAIAYFMLLMIANFLLYFRKDK